MKNALNYYYNLNIDNIHQKNKNYYFKVNNLQYMLLECVNEEINDIYSLNVYLTKNYPFYKIILNKDNKVITIINETNYILLEINNNIKELNLNEIIKINNISIVNLNKLRRDNWYTLWTNKIDYFEYQINQIGKKYPIIRESFNYYIGLAETAISLIKSINNEGMYLSLSHKRINNAFDLYNPLNITIDYSVRDIAEYFKKFGRYLVIEYVSKTDSKVRQMLTNRADVFNDYTIEGFEKVFKKSYKILKKTGVNIGDKNDERILYLMEKV